MSYFIFQGSDHECGFASLKMLLANLKKDKSYLYINKIIDKEAFSVNDICNEAKNYGLILDSYAVDEDYFTSLKKLSLTLIRDNHVVVITNVNKKKITYLDPEIGKITLKKEQFISIWCKIVIEVEDASKIKNISKNRLSILPLKLRIFEACAAVFSAAILIVTFYLFNKEENAIFSLLFLLLFITTQLIENLIISKEINFFDKTYIERYFSNPKNQSKLSYLEFLGFKQNYFTNSRGLLSSSLVAFTITFLLCVNDFRNMFALLALILLKVLDLLCFSKSNDDRKYLIGKYEEKCFKSKKQYVEYALKANKLASQKVTENSIKQIVYITIAFAFAMVMMILTGNNGCNYVIFHFGLYYFGFNSYSQLLNGLSNNKEMKKMESRFFYTCNL